MATNANANTNDIIVLALIPSFIWKLVNIANDIIPVANPIKRPGHKDPSKCPTTYFVAIINAKDIGIENINAMANGFFAHHSHLNCPFV